jgi:hypothetical protein
MVDAAVDAYASNLLAQGQSIEQIIDYIAGVLNKTVQNSQQKPHLVGNATPAIPEGQHDPQQKAEGRENAPLSSGKRSLPLRPKDSNVLLIGVDVYDEWAAVLRHQDEVTRESERLEKARQKELQKAYLQELDQQRREIHNRSQQRQENGSIDDKVAVALQKEMANEAAVREQKRIQEKKALAQSLVEQNIKEKQKVQQEHREQLNQEHTLIQSTLRRMQEEDEKKAAAERNAKARLISSLQESYAVQASMAKRQKERERELDKLFTAQQVERTAESERAREKVREPEPWKLVLRDASRQTEAHTRERKVVRQICSTAA